MTCDIGNLGPGLAQAQKYGRVKPVNGILILITGSQMAIHILKTNMFINTPRIYYKEFINKEICHLNGKIKLL